MTDTIKPKDRLTCPMCMFSSAHCVCLVKDHVRELKHLNMNKVIVTTLYRFPCCGLHNVSGIKRHREFKMGAVIDY